MRQITKKINIFLLFLALTVFNAHLVIPHDHHLSVDDLCSSNKFPYTNSNHHPVFPAHCQAFNDLVLEKAVVVNQFRTFHIFDAANSEMQNINLPAYPVSFIEDTEHPVNSSPSELFLLRAPPSCC